jgi:CheY-like chemotaxis protein
VTRKTEDVLKSILLVDDDEDSLKLVTHLLKERTKATIVSARFPSAAIKLASEHFFDIILIDVTMNYNGTPFGGLELYKALMGRYGRSSLVVYSQFITDDLLKQYEYNFNFIERGTDYVRFAEQLLPYLNSLRRQQTCFIAMPFQKKYDGVFSAIEACINKADYKCVRVDQRTFTKSIIDQVFMELKDSKLVVFLATDQNPNAFYECGYGVALDKEIVTITDTYKSLPFDIRDRNAIAYAADMRGLKAKLIKRLRQLTVVR